MVLPVSCVFSIRLLDLGFGGCLDIFSTLGTQTFSSKLGEETLHTQKSQYPGRGKSDRDQRLQGNLYLGFNGDPHHKALWRGRPNFPYLIPERWSRQITNICDMFCDEAPLTMYFQGLLRGKYIICKTSEQLPRGVTSIYDPTMNFQRTSRSCNRYLGVLDDNV